MDNLLTQYNNGASLAELAIQHGASKTTVLRRLTALGYVPRTREQSISAGKHAARARTLAADHETATEHQGFITLRNRLAALTRRVAQLEHVSKGASHE